MKPVENRSIVHFSNNKAALFSGGAVSAWDSDVTFGGTVVVFRNNSAGIFGGALRSIDKTNVAIKASLVYFTGNTARRGGAIDVSGKSLRIGEETTILFSANEASSDGGAIYIETLPFQVVHCSLRIKPIMMVELSQQISLKMNGNVLKFEENVVRDYTTLVLTATAVDFVGNVARRNGGGVLLSGHSGMVLISANFVNNTATNCGGAAYAGDLTDVYFETQLSLGTLGVLYAYLEAVTCILVVVRTSEKMLEDMVER